MYSPVDGYRCTATAVATASRRRRPQYSMTAATAGPLLIRKADRWQRVRCGTAAAAGPSSNRIPHTRAFTTYSSRVVGL